jgi:hypothetical protein
MLHSRIARLSLSSVLGVAALASTAAIATSSASAATVSKSVVVNGKCSGKSVDNLQLQREHTGQLSIDFGVDMARHISGVPWKITESRNGVVFVNTTKKTIADGSFSVTRLLATRTGTNTVTATATNTRTGETCKITASL